MENNLENETPKNESEETLFEKTPEENTEETPKNDSEGLTPERLVEIKKKAELADAYKVRAEKAEKELKRTQKETKMPEKEHTLSTRDTIALIDAKISAEDFDKVVDWANFKKISVSDALKDKTLQVVLRENAEERDTANATTIKGGSGFKKETPEEIVRQAKQRIPETDEEIEKLAEANYQLKMRKLQK